ncbi:hypothetical protein Pfo_018280 [Paulownia fortunei]|nr:hypothetical protein Pfo_018280 [Paulownia fortunei]
MVTQDHPHENLIFLKEVLPRGNTLVNFCGEVIIFCGDFRQILPIVLAELLLRVRNNEEPNDAECNIKISEEMINEYDNEENSILRFIRVIFQTLNKNAHSTHYMTSRAILAAKNEHVDKLNNKLIFIFPQKTRTLYRFGEAVNDTNNYYKYDVLNTLTPNGLHPYKLDFKNNINDAEIVYGQYNEKYVFIPRVPLLPTENKGNPFQFRCKQFRIKLCFVMTIKTSSRTNNSIS